METKQKRKSRPKRNKWVLGAGGCHGPGHLGVWKRAQDLGVTVDEDEVLGVSVGALEAAFLTNGYTPDEIAPIFLEMIRSRRNPITLLKAYHPMDPFSLTVSGFLKLMFAREVGTATRMRSNEQCEHKCTKTECEPGCETMTKAIEEGGKAGLNAFPFMNLVASMQDPDFLNSTSWGWMKAFQPADPVSVMIGGYFRLLPYMQELVQKYDLKPNKRLRILACDQAHRPVIFEGEDYDLAVALAASGSVPGAFQPVWHMHEGQMKLLVDGAVYHYNPTEFSEGTCIVSKFRPATEYPKEWETWWDVYFHMRELFFPLAGNSRYVDESKHIVIEAGLPDVAGLNLGISDATIQRMITNGYEAAGPILEKAIAEGRVAVK